MKIAFLNLCHAEPTIMSRVASKLTIHPGFSMYIHVDAKSDIEPFKVALEDIPDVFFANERIKLYWGGFNAVRATILLLRQALNNPISHDYFVVLQNLDYPIRSNDYISNFFIEREGTEFIRGCPIARTKDWHYASKYKIYNQRDDDFYLKKRSKQRMYMRYAHMLLKSYKTILSNGIIHENGKEYAVHYGAAQWAITRKLAEYIVDFYDSHPKFNKYMEHVQFPDEKYFHTIVHNSDFKYNCIKYDEPAKRWLVNWRNLHYFEYPREIKVFTEADFKKIMAEDVLFIRKVREGISNSLMDRIDSAVMS
ncbi:MAG: beta-1,6-N-acetylglucosaminyltransferase [Oscillospiraceae bacterium]|nr:beta-1,6-N-acetylglucosaminyltransferase [Oscillospiraceae bacterium]